MNADREKIFRVVLGDSGFFFHGVSHVIDSVVELWRVVVDVEYVDDDGGGVGVFVVEYSVCQLIALSVTNMNN